MPEQSIFHTNLAIALDNQNKHKQAENHFLLALKLSPDDPQTLFSYARSLEQQNNYDAAKKLYLSVLRIIPNHEGAMLNLSSIYLNQNLPEQSTTILENLLEYNPKNAKALNSLGNIYRKTNIDKAVNLFYRAVLIEPGLAPALINLYICSANTCNWQKKNYAIQQMKLYSVDLPPLFYNELTQSLEDNFTNSRNFAPKVQEQYVFRHKSMKKKRISLGYIGSDFFNHATMHLMQGLFENHDYEKFDIHVFSYGKSDQSSYSKVLHDNVKQVHDISNSSDYDAAKLIYNNDIDLLIDLKGHTQGARLAILAYKPAPIQVHYLGFPGTIGADYIDYYLGDDIITPISMQEFFSEKIYNLPHCYQANTPIKVQGTASRHEHGLPENKFIYASFNQCYKISQELCNTWMQILQKTSNSILWILAESDSTKESILNCAINYNVCKDRIIFAKGLEKEQHLKRLSLADLALDTINYNGHTTTSDCMMANVPVLTILGTHPPSRVSSSILNELKINDLICTDLDEYKEKAISLCNTQNIQSIKDRIIKNKNNCILLSPDKFTKNFESAISSIYQMES